MTFDIFEIFSRFFIRLRNVFGANQYIRVKIIKNSAKAYLN